MAAAGDASRAAIASKWSASSRGRMIIASWPRGYFAIVPARFSLCALCERPEGVEFGARDVRSANLIECLRMGDPHRLVERCERLRPNPRAGPFGIRRVEHAVPFGSLGRNPPAIAAPCAPPRAIAHFAPERAGRARTDRAPERTHPGTRDVHPLRYAIRDATNDHAAIAVPDQDHAVQVELARARATTTFCAAARAIQERRWPGARWVVRGAPRHDAQRRVKA